MKQVLSLTLAINLIMLGGYVFLEPQIIKADTGLTAISLSVTGEININCSSTVALVPSIAGQSGGIATTTFGCVVETNDSAGYNFTLEKDQKLQITDVADQRFDDYTTSTDANPDWAWDSVGAGNEEFGFNIVSSASTTDIVQLFLDNGSDTCGTSTSITAWQCWYPIPTSPAVQVVNRSSATVPGGQTTVFGLQAEAGSSNNLEEGTYNSTTTVTAVTN